MKLDPDTLRTILACPGCRNSLDLTESQDARCSGCLAVYPRLSTTWDLRPLKWNTTDPRWQAWEQLQQNGLVSYLQDPDHNLGIGERPDCKAFSQFCKYYGLVLDVGCGPQKWPAYFDPHANNTTYFGVDPLTEDQGADYYQFRALGEFLPFADRVFDHVVFATSLDHFVDPVQALKEAGRVCKKQGEIDIWIGEKSKDAPKPAISPEWYKQLPKPDAAEDVFHLKRFTPADLANYLDAARLRVEEHVTLPIDAFRKNHFYRTRLQTQA